MKDATEDLADGGDLAGALGGRRGGGLRQAEDLIVGFEEGDEVGGHELVTGGRQGHGIESEETREAGVGVEAQAAGVGDGEEEEIEREGIGTAVGGEAGTEEALVAPAEAGWDMTETLGSEQDFVMIIHETEGRPPAPCWRMANPFCLRRSIWMRMSSCNAEPRWSATRPTRTG